MFLHSVFSPCCKICKFTSLCYLGPTWASTDLFGRNYKPTSRYMLSTFQASLFLLGWNAIIDLILGFKKLFINLPKTHSLIKWCTDNYYYYTLSVCVHEREREKPCNSWIQEKSPSSGTIEKRSLFLCKISTQED